MAKDLLCFHDLWSLCLQLIWSRHICSFLNMFYAFDIVQIAWKKMLEAVKWDVEGAALSRGLPYLASGVLDRQRTAVSLLFNICSVAAYQRNAIHQSSGLPSLSPKSARMQLHVIRLFCRCSVLLVSLESPENDMSTRPPNFTRIVCSTMFHPIMSNFANFGRT